MHTKGAYRFILVSSFPQLFLNSPNYLLLSSNYLGSATLNHNFHSTLSTHLILHQLTFYYFPSHTTTESPIEYSSSILYTFSLLDNLSISSLLKTCLNHFNLIYYILFCLVLIKAIYIAHLLCTNLLFCLL